MGLRRDFETAKSVGDSQDFFDVFTNTELKRCSTFVLPHFGHLVS